MLFMMALSVSSHFNCFGRRWIQYLSDDRSGPGERLSSCPSPPPAGGLPSGFPVVRIAGSRQEHFQNGDEWRQERGI